MPRTPKTGSQSFWHFVSDICPTIGGHRLYNNIHKLGKNAHLPPKVSETAVAAMRLTKSVLLAANETWPIENGLSARLGHRTNIHKASRCAVGQGVYRLMIVRDPVSHFGSLKATYTAWTKNVKSENYLHRMVGHGKKNPPPRNLTTLAELSRALPRLYDNPQSRFLLGFPYNPIGGIDIWAVFRKMTPDNAIRELIKSAVHDLDFVAITDQWDRSLLLLRNLTGWKFDGYNKILHETDVGHPRSNSRKLFLRSEIATIRKLNKWDYYLYKVATNVLKQRSVNVLGLDSIAVCNNSKTIRNGWHSIKCSF